MTCWLSPERVQTAITLRERGLSWNEIGPKLNVHPDTVRKIIKRQPNVPADLMSMRVVQRNPYYALAIQMLEEGKSRRDIRLATNLNRDQIGGIIRRWKKRRAKTASN